jgi:hypothetical protein
MIPKSLLLSVGMGVVAAAALGIYFAKLGSQDLEFAQGPAISVFVEKQNYKLGEKISIGIINSGTTKVTFSSELPSLRIRALDGTVFFSTSFNGLQLTPNQRHVFEWEQLKNDNSKVIEGRYVIDSFAYDADNQKISDSVTVNIVK